VLCYASAALRPREANAVEFLNFVLIFVAGYLVLRRPEREGLAFALAVASTLLMVFLFLVGTRTSLLPGLNY
jgi:hypothetical protein